MKRFTDTDLEDKLWFVELPPRLKCLVRYVQNKCDQVGVWDPNFKTASQQIGEVVTETELLEIDNGQQFTMLETGKIFIPDFVSFQYGTLSEKCIPHRSYIKLLVKHNLLHTLDVGYKRAFHTLKEKDTDKDKEKEEGGLGETKIPYAEKKQTEELDWKFEKQKFLTDTAWQESYLMLNGGTEWNLKTRVEEFMKGVESAEDHKTCKELKSHFTNWDRKKSKPTSDVKGNGQVYIKPKVNEPLQDVTKIKPEKTESDWQGMIQKDIDKTVKGIMFIPILGAVKIDWLDEHGQLDLSDEEKLRYSLDGRDIFIQRLMGTAEDISSRAQLDYYKRTGTWKETESAKIRVIAKELAYRDFLNSHLPQYTEPAESFESNVEST